jgi:hypothetical protein
MPASRTTAPSNATPASRVPVDTLLSVESSPLPPLSEQLVSGTAKRSAVSSAFKDE